MSKKPTTSTSKVVIIKRPPKEETQTQNAGTMAAVDTTATEQAIQAEEAVDGTKQEQAQKK